MTAMNHLDLLQLTYYRGRVALYAILKGLGIGRGDEVATQAFTCLAVPEAILATGARPVFLDLQPDGVNLDPEEIRRKVSERTKAVIVQHTFGIPADMAAILKQTNPRGIPVIEDCCHTLESKIQGRPVGSLGMAAFYSYEWGKPVVAGLGGSARVNDPQLLATMLASQQSYQPPRPADNLKLNIQYGIHKLLYRPQLYWPLKNAFHRLSRLGLAKGNYNSLTEDQPAEDFTRGMGRRQKRILQRKLATAVSEHAAHSLQLASQLTDSLSELSTIRFPVSPPGSESVLARFPVQVQDKPRLLALARENNVELAEWYATPVHPVPAGQAAGVGLQPEECPQAEQRTREIVSLPLHQRVTARHIDRAIELFRKAA